MFGRRQPTPNGHAGVTGMRPFPDRRVAGQLDVGLTAHGDAIPASGHDLRPLPVDDARGAARVELLVGDGRVAGRSRGRSPGIVDRPARRVVGAGSRAGPAGGRLDRERVLRRGGASCRRLDERPVDERIRAVRVPNERERDVGPVVEVDREPVPAPATDADEVTPLVVEPGLAGDRDRRVVERQLPDRRHRRSRVVVRAAAGPEVDPAVAIVERRRLAAREREVEPEGRRSLRGRFGAAERDGEMVLAIRAAHRPGGSVEGRRSVGSMPVRARSKPVGGHRRRGDRSTPWPTWRRWP